MLIDTIGGLSQLASLAGSIFGMGKGLFEKAPAMPIQALSYEDALKQASSQLNPLYDDQLTKRMGQVTNDLAARGMLGQSPGGSVMRSNAMDIEKARASAIAAMANENYQQNQSNLLSAWQTQLGYMNQKPQQAAQFGSLANDWFRGMNYNPLWSLINYNAGNNLNVTK
jgi:hypothetical protein